MTNQVKAQIGQVGEFGGLSRSEEHTSELQSLITISYAVFCLKKKTQLRMLLVNECAIDPARFISVMHYDGTPITARFINGAIAERLQINVFFFNDTATTEIYTVMNTLSLHDALPISRPKRSSFFGSGSLTPMRSTTSRSEEHTSELQSLITISYAVFCLKKKKKHIKTNLYFYIIYKKKKKK